MEDEVTIQISSNDLCRLTLSQAFSIAQNYLSSQGYMCMSYITHVQDINGYLFYMNVWDKKINNNYE